MKLFYANKITSDKVKLTEVFEILDIAEIVEILSDKATCRDAYASKKKRK